MDASAHQNQAADSSQTQNCARPPVRQADDVRLLRQARSHVPLTPEEERVCDMATD